jgi:hypothetical protein
VIMSKSSSKNLRFFCTGPPPTPEQFFFLGYHKGKKTLGDQRKNKFEKYRQKWVQIAWTLEDSFRFFQEYFHNSDIHTNTTYQKRIIIKLVRMVSQQNSAMNIKSYIKLWYIVLVDNLLPMQYKIF